MSRTLSSRSFYSSRMSSYSASMMWKRLLAAGSIALVGIVALVVCSSRFRYTDSPHPSGIDVFDVPAKVTEKAGMLLLSELKKASKDLRSGKSVKPSELVKLRGKQGDGGTPSPSLSPTLTPTLSVSTIVILSYLL